MTKRVRTLIAAVAVALPTLLFAPPADARCIGAGADGLQQALCSPCPMGVPAIVKNLCHAAD